MEQQTQNTNRHELSVEKPALEGIPVYVDGNLDKRREILRYGAFTAKMAGYVAWRGLEITINVMDELVTEFNKQYS